MRKEPAFSDFDVWREAWNYAVRRARSSGRRAVVWRCQGMWRVATAMRQTRGPWYGYFDRSTIREPRHFACERCRKRIMRGMRCSCGHDVIVEVEGAASPQFDKGGAWPAGSPYRLADDECVFRLGPGGPPFDPLTCRRADETHLRAAHPEGNKP